MSMRRSFKQVFQGLFAAAAVASVLISPALAAEKKDFKVAWSIYVGWMPWGYAHQSRHREEMGRQNTASISRSRSSTTMSS